MAPSATSPVARLTSDSRASDHRLTEPVTYHAANLRAIVAIEVAIDRYAILRTARIDCSVRPVERSIIARRRRSGVEANQAAAAFAASPMASANTRGSWAPD